MLRVCKLFALGFIASLPLKAIGADAQPAAPQSAGVISTTQIQHITGAGGTFPAPAYANWAEAARTAIGVDLTYNAVGSESGQYQIIARKVDFGASDAPVSDARLAKADLLQFPTVVGGVVVIVNLPRVHDLYLRLTGPVLADIFAGKIVRWSDPRLVALNPEITLPNLPIAPVHRYEPSGTSFVFTSYLSTVSRMWKSAVGAGPAVHWPIGAGATANDGVATTVNITRGGIGYVEYTYATENHLNMARLRNKSGVYVTPDTASIAAAAAAADWRTPNFAVSLVDTSGAANWPIVATTFILLPKNPQDPAHGAAVMKFFDWAYRNGGAIAKHLDYIPLPAAVQDSVRAEWGAEVSFHGERLYK